MKKKYNSPKVEMYQFITKPTMAANSYDDSTMTKTMTGSSTTHCGWDFDEK